MASAVISRWARRFLLAALCFLVLSQLAAIAGLARRTEVLLGLHGFVLGVVFGKAYSLVPSYFDRTLAVPRAPAAHLPIHVTAVGSLALSTLSGSPDWLAAVGGTLWALGVLVFLGAVGVTIASNPLGRETGTGGVNREREWLDRLANRFVPLALGYLAVGSYALLGASTPLPTLLDGVAVRSSHLLAAGFALLVLFSVGFRLLPRFLVATPPRWLALVALPAGAVGPALLAIGYPAGPVFVVGAALEATAVAAFALAYWRLFRATDRDRIGFYGPLFGLLAGLVGVGLGLQFAFVGFDASLARAHRHLNVFGLLGLSILGVLYQFYPPGVAAWRGAGDRLALGSLAVGFAGVLLLGLEPVGGRSVALAGHLAVLGAGAIAIYCVAGAIRTQTAGR